MIVTAVSLLLALAAALVFDGWKAFGHKPTGGHRRSMETSPQWARGRFRNRLPLRNFALRSLRDLIYSSRLKVPAERVDIWPNDGRVYAQPPASGLRVSWLGHSTLLLEVADTTLLIDPVWGPRASPFRWLGPKRWYESPLALDALPKIDAVLISHDHYDHLDRNSIVALAGKVDRFIVPLGVGAHLMYWGVPASFITEVDWWDEVAVNAATVTATPARHASGRHLMDIDSTLWTGFVIHSEKQRVFYSGDTGLFPGLKEIGQRLGPFDLAMIEAGAYSRNWPDWHLGPEQAVIACQWVRGKRLLPLHWGLFSLSTHNWTEPMERVLAASSKSNLEVLTPRPGQPFEPGISTFDPWWPEIPWTRPDEHAVRSTQLEGLTEHEIRLIDGG